MRAAIIALAGGIVTSAGAGETYGVYSGAGWNEVFGPRPPRTLRLAPAITELNGGWANPATFGTAANPVPIHGPALWFRLPDGSFRAVPVN